MGKGRGDWWRPARESRWGERVSFVGAAISIILGALALASATWTLAETQDGRIKALLWWCIGVTAFMGFLFRSLRLREHRDVRFARSLEAMHLAHHHLRDAAYHRYIRRADDEVWHEKVQESLVQFASAMSVATGTVCHATIKEVDDQSGEGGDSRATPEHLQVNTFLRSAERHAVVKDGVPNTVGRNSDFRKLFSPDDDNRCWYNNDLLALGDDYDNPHWPASPTRRSVPYRATMVWPIRKVLRQPTGDLPRDFYIHGFVTIDCNETQSFEYERHFQIGAAYADHLLSVLWDPNHVREVADALSPGGQGTDETNDT